MSFFRTILAVILTVLVAAFAAFNTQPVEVLYSPIHDPMMVPLYIIALGGVAIGFVAGAFMVWLNSSTLRKDRRKKKKEIKHLEKEVTKLKEDKFSPKPPAQEMFPALPSQ